MAYCDFDFYTNSYYGNVIQEADFPRLANRASDKLDQLTFDRLVDAELDERTSIKVRKAVCRLAELILDVESAENAARQSTGFTVGADGTVKGKAIASISAGSESISFMSGTGNSMIANAMSDSKALERLYFEAVREYIGGTGLLYAGV